MFVTVPDFSYQAEEGRIIKEKDLQNHLEAESGDKKKRDKKSESTPQTEPSPEMKNRHGPLELERLQTDNQVMRALDILVSHNLLSRHGG